MELRIEEVSKAYRQQNEGQGSEVLAGISFLVREGQFVTLLGPSGCGKTTLLSIIAGFLPADEGRILLNGRTVARPGPDRGFVFQDYALFPWMTVRENIVFPMKQRGLPRPERERRLYELLAMARLEGKENLYPHQLSGGMKQRTAFIRALAGKPEVLLMDEPLGAIDIQMRQDLQEELEELWMKDRTTVLMVTHDVDEAVYLSDRVLVMSHHGGKILEDLKIDLSRPRDRRGGSYQRYREQLLEVLSSAREGMVQAEHLGFKPCLALSSD